MKKVIGIVSWFPENTSIREARKKKLNSLLAKCNELFNLPIVIVAQQWTNLELNDIDSKYKNITIYSTNDKLGITGARRKLRELFLNSDYDYLIMIDDDVQIVGTSGAKYLKQIDDNPDCFIENNKSRLQLFAISKYCFSQLDFDDIEPEKGEGFEDRIFFYTLKERLPDRYRKFENTGIVEHAIATKDPLSTWYNNQDLASMNERTKKLIELNKQS